MGPNVRKISERDEKEVGYATVMDLVLPTLCIFLGNSVEVSGV